MICHIVLIKFNPNTPDEKKEVIFSLLKNLKKEIPGIKEWSTGKQLQKTDNNYDLAEVGSFENLESLETFRQHPAHQKVRNMIRAVGSWTVIDYEY